MIITPKMVNSEFEVENGNSSRKVKITSDHVGHRLGEFYESKVHAMKFFFKYELSKTTYLAEVLMNDESLTIKDAEKKVFV